MMDSLWIMGFVLLLAVRLLAAAFSPIMDCDETYNYWEPLHYVLYGSGQQTWEYAPQYALRSWTYIELHAVMARLAAGSLEKPLVFFAVRQGLAVTCATCELAFCHAAAAKFGDSVGLLTLVFSMASSGMFHSGVAFLPSTTCMYCVLLGHACWLRGRFALGLALGSFAVLLAWPFVAPMFVPMGLHALLATGALPVLTTAVVSLIGFGVVPAVIDGRYYGPHGANGVYGAVSAVGNLLLYNVVGSGGGGDGANLYGTEPASFYPKNLILNFNLIAAAALPSLVLLALLRRGPALLHLTPMLCAFAVFQSMAHKEERFLTMIYPSLWYAKKIGSEPLPLPSPSPLPPSPALSLSLDCQSHRHDAVVPRVPRPVGSPVLLAPLHPTLSHPTLLHLAPARTTPLHLPNPWSSLCAALGLDAAVRLAKKGTALAWLVRLGAVLFVCVTVAVSASRTTALVRYYGAPIRVWSALGKGWPTAKYVCVGKEWYRFPSSFFLPPGAGDVLWLKSDFGGQLPQPFAPWPNGSAELRPHFNDRNAEEPSRYAELSECDFVVDLDLPDQKEKHLVNENGWGNLFCAPFLDAARSRSILARAFYIPGVSERANVFAEYCLARHKVSGGIRPPKV